MPNAEDSGGAVGIDQGNPRPEATSFVLVDQPAQPLGVKAATLATSLTPPEPTSTGVYVFVQFPTRLRESAQRAFVIIFPTLPAAAEGRCVSEGCAAPAQ